MHLGNILTGYRRNRIGDQYVARGDYHGYIHWVKGQFERLGRMESTSTIMLR